jgi:hypothetical protein
VGLLDSADAASELVPTISLPHSQSDLRISPDHYGNSQYGSGSTRSAQQYWVNTMSNKSTISKKSSVGTRKTVGSKREYVKDYMKKRNLILALVVS